MSKAQHTIGWSIPAEDFDSISSSLRRRKAEILACEGISTEALEDGVVKEMREALEIALPYVQALHDNISAAIGHENTPVLGNLEKIRASLAKAKGE